MDKSMAMHRGRKQKNSIKIKIIESLDSLIKARFIIVFIIFVLMLLFKVHGSSINLWDQYVSDYSDGADSGLIFGTPRQIRSDEWLVQTPYSLSQTQTGFRAHNEVITLNGQDMTVGYNSPAFTLATIAKPFTWGYVLLGKEYGLSWYWGIKLIGLVLFSFEIGLILSRRNKYIALLTSLWIPFSSAIQWWFVSPVGDLVFFMLGFLTAIYNYFYYHENKPKRMAFSIISAICASGFILVLYPALQVPFGYLILLFLVGFFLEFKSKLVLDKFDGLFIGLAVLITLILVGGSILFSWDSIYAVMHTIYPGNRISTGGDFDKKDIFLFLMNWKMSFTDVSYSNNSELSGFYQFFFVILPLAPVLFYKKVKDNYYGFLLFIYSCIQLLWVLVKFPMSFAKITLWSFVPEERALLSFSFTAVLLSVWFISYIWEQNKIDKIAIIGIIALNATAYFYALYRGNLRLYLSKTEIIIILVMSILILSSLLLKRKGLFSILFVSVILFTGLTVNPIARGVAPIYDKKIGHKITEINRTDPNQLWVGERLMYSYLPMFGVHTFNGVAFTPDMTMWKVLDADGKQEKIYNRYAHIHADITNEKPDLELLNSDALLVRLDSESIKKIGIKYLVTYKEINSLATDDVKFDKLYGPDKDGAYIYKAIY
ncbi:hypothetical protein UAW_02779 [Enterococcus haemoperoxidus ATCC BAA-382]|uniref:Glycosyltransferase RgtA/B/C/D-like domain-containing protein n=1 Tax=Enterococcus haemoperoxidus ATCC BAA-382 TaxID=1158608 RepID=R2SB29_9ENTE|nr:hypothetical protein [Enterococcus haemoperoxidus]EOH92740.1 hypothetical protein UAW_02779 [Enterococcus haemoperoxidus ATCC BAA-382]EOT61483.1 hypothetical protein I583_00463 [Enterococcus haemoperoxidus ATCC BAA-382]